MHEKVALEHSSKSTKYELEGSYGDLVHEHFSVCADPFLRADDRSACTCFSLFLNS